MSDELRGQLRAALATAPPTARAHPGSEAFLRHLAVHYPELRAAGTRRQLVAAAIRAQTEIGGDPPPGRAVIPPRYRDAPGGITTASDALRHGTSRALEAECTGRRVG